MPGRLSRKQSTHLLVTNLSKRGQSLVEWPGRYYTTHIPERALVVGATVSKQGGGMRRHRASDITPGHRKPRLECAVFSKLAVYVTSITTTTTARVHFDS